MLDAACNNYETILCSKSIEALQGFILDLNTGLGSEEEQVNDSAKVWMGGCQLEEFS